MKNRIILLATICLMACSSSMDNKEAGVEMGNEPVNGEVLSKQLTSKGILSGTWKVVDFQDSLATIHPDTIASARATFLSSFYIFKNDSVYTVRNSRIPSGDDGKWELAKVGSGYHISFLSNTELYKDAYQVMFLDANTMQWVKVIPELGKYAVLLKKQ